MGNRSAATILNGRNYYSGKILPDTSMSSQHCSFYSCALSCSFQQQPDHLSFPMSHKHGHDCIYKFSLWFCEDTFN